jgi:hypothetical protein
VFGNLALRGVVGNRRDEVTGEWRKLHNEELYVLYCSPNVTMVIKKKDAMGGACRTCWRKERCVQDV